MKRKIFTNIKRWLIEYGVDILDLILEPVDEMSRDTTIRYENFMHELNRHFSTAQFYKSNFNAHLPLLTVDVSNVGYSSQCYCEYLITFKFHWTTISADQELILENTPEGNLDLEDKVDRRLKAMMFSRSYIENEVVYRDIFQDLQKLPNFEDKICNVVSISDYPVTFEQVYDEINTISKQFKITVGECG